jgi:hypothetical protein
MRPQTKEGGERGYIWKLLVKDNVCGILADAGHKRRASGSPRKLVCLHTHVSVRWSGPTCANRANLECAQRIHARVGPVARENQRFIGGREHFACKIRRSIVQL